jgi:hypothetical protein
MKVSLKPELYIVPVLMALGVQQLWADITIDLGPSRIVTNQIDRIAFSDLNGTPVAGTLSVDFVFSNDAFVRLFNQYFVPGGSVQGIGTSSLLDLDLRLQTSGSGLVGFLNGTGYIFDRAGNPIPGYGVIGSASSDQGAMFIGLFPLLRDRNGTPNSNLLRPLDFYGVHFDLIFPQSSSLKVTGADFAITDGGGGEFGIGPNIPIDIPEPSPFAFAGLGALAYLLSRRRS